MNGWEESLAISCSGMEELTSTNRHIATGEFSLGKLSQTANDETRGKASA
jgi:hypothetical protein